MLKPAYFVDNNKLELKIYEAMLLPENKYYRFSLYSWYQNDDKSTDEFNGVNMVSVDPDSDEILGYYTASYNRQSRVISCCSFIKFNKTHILAKKIWNCFSKN